MKYIILIPAYEPDNKLIDLVKEINNKYKVIVIDDGNKNKDIFKAIKEYSYVISYDNNRGKGFALKTGLCCCLYGCRSSAYT